MAFDEELLETAVQRRGALAALAAEPRHRRELQDELDVSKTTCHRIVRSFEQQGLLQRTDQGYALTELGRVVEAAVGRFDRTVRAACRLEPLVDAFGSAPVDFDAELFADATVTEPGPEDPSPPVHRFLELFRDAETVRSVDRTSFAPPLYVEEMVETVADGGGRGVAVFPESVVRNRLSAYPDLHRRVVEEELALQYRIHDGVPFGLTLFDRDRVGLRAYDDETGALVLFVDTDDPDAVAWAEGVFEQYYEASEPLSAFESLPDWVLDSERSV